MHRVMITPTPTVAPVAMEQRCKVVLVRHATAVTDRNGGKVAQEEAAAALKAAVKAVVEAAAKETIDEQNIVTPITIFISVIARLRQ